MADTDNDATSGDTDEASRPGAHGKLTSLTPEQALERLRRGQPLQDVRVEKLCFAGEFPFAVKMKNCHLIKPRFDRAEFKAEVLMTGCTLEHPHFNRPSVCAGDLSLRGSTLQNTQIMRLTVKGNTNFELVQTRGSFGIIDCTFEGMVRFWEASVHNWINIKKTTFKGEADFRSLHVHKGVSFNACRFESAALFRGMFVAMKCDLGNSHFEGLVDFSRAKLNDYVYLEGVTQGQHQRFAFANAIGERLLLRPEQLVNRLDSEITGNHEQAMHEYALLKRAFGALHRYEQEDWAFYRFKVNQRRARPRSWLRPWTRLAQFGDWLLLDIGCGYGANPMRAVRAALVIMLGFAMIYIGWIDHFYADTNKLPFPGEELTSWPNRITVGTLVSVSTFISGVGGIRELAPGWMNLPLVIESLMGTLLWGLFIVSFSRKVIR